MNDDQGNYNSQMKVKVLSVECYRRSGLEKRNFATCDAEL